MLIVYHEQRRKSREKLKISKKIENECDENWNPLFPPLKSTHLLTAPDKICLTKKIIYTKLEIS